MPTSRTIATMRLDRVSPLYITIIVFTINFGSMELSCQDSNAVKVKIVKKTQVCSMVVIDFFLETFSKEITEGEPFSPLGSISKPVLEV